MSVLEWTILGLCAVPALATLLRHAAVSWALRGMRFLQPDDPGVIQPAPKVSILIPAKDEGAVIGRCLRSLLAQDYPSFDILVIDDRSRDDTAAQVAELAAIHARIRLLTIDALPSGWTGKTHALHVGQQRVDGDFLLFVDADTTHHPRCLSVAVRDALDQRADLLSMMPAIEALSFWEHVVQPFAGVCLMSLYPLGQVNDPTCKEHGFANGQFILMPRAAYDALGGHESVKDKFVEDIQLGRQVRQSGGNLRVVMGGGVCKVRMYSSLAAILRGWSRIFYSAFQGQSLKVAGLTAGILAFSVLNYVMLALFGVRLLMGDRSPFALAMFAVAAAHSLSQTVLMARLYVLAGVRPTWVLLRPLAVGAMLCVLWRTWRMCRTGAVTWRGTTYGGELRQG